MPQVVARGWASADWSLSPHLSYLSSSLMYGLERVTCAYRTRSGHSVFCHIFTLWLSECVRSKMSQLHIPVSLPLPRSDTDSDSDTGSGSGTITPLLRFLPPTLLLPTVPSSGVRRRHSWICGIKETKRVAGRKPGSSGVVAQANPAYSDWLSSTGFNRPESNSGRRR
ncbi:hypothetical protein J6590_012802 [Homalodisca vitripennis]|nr:hypothetical protein J6590_012802 [Homalodisca vitripennis]